MRGLDTADEEPSVLENEEVSGGNNAEKIMAAGYVTKKSVMQVCLLSLYLCLSIYFHSIWFPL